MTISLYLSNKSSNKKQKAKFEITNIINQKFRKFLKKFNNSPYLGYKSKQVHNKPTEDYFFLIKQITKLMKIDRHIQIRNIFFILSINKRIGHINKRIMHNY